MFLKVIFYFFAKFNNLSQLRPLQVIECSSYERNSSMNGKAFSFSVNFLRYSKESK